ncbi:MAG: vWA domain-containing protein [Eubacteriales bacterium]|nr:vWA domain-containing protein [Eubacteriales bacterium]
MSWDISGDKQANPTVLDSNQRVTEITLTLPSAQHPSTVDIVFVMDKSTSTATEGVDFSEQVMALLDGLSTSGEDLLIKIGVIKFRGRASDAINTRSYGTASRLLEYSDNNKGLIIDAIKYATAPGRGSNIHAGLRMAEQWLAADYEVPAGNKYVVLLTDCKSYIWNDENDIAVTNYTQWYNNHVIQDGGMPVLNQKAGSNDKEAYPFELDENLRDRLFCIYDYASLFASNDPRLTSKTDFDEKCHNAYTFISQDIPTGTVERLATTNGGDVFPYPYSDPGNFYGYESYYKYTPTPGSKWEGVSYYQANPYQLVKNLDGTYAWDTNSPNEAFYMFHPDCLQKGLYKAGHLWYKMQNQYGYKCAAIVSNPASSTGLGLVGSFSEWLKEQSSYSTDISNTANLNTLLSNISRDIIYMVGQGVVTDQITDEFMLVEPEDGSCPFTLTLGDNSLAPTGLGANSWGFGEIIDIDGDGTPDLPSYQVQYDTDNKQLQWAINVPVKNSEHIALSYKVLLKEDALQRNDYATNAWAVLNYQSSNGQTQGQFSFPVPWVSYYVPDDPTPSESEADGPVLWPADPEDAMDYYDEEPGIIDIISDCSTDSLETDSPTECLPVTEEINFLIEQLPRTGQSNYRGFSLMLILSSLATMGMSFYINKR